MRKIKSGIKEHQSTWKATGPEIFTIGSTLKNRPSLKHLDAWNALIVHVKKHVQWVLISDRLFTRFKTKIIMVLLKLFYQIIHLDYHVGVFVQWASYVRLPVMHIGLREVQFRSVNYKNSLVMYSEKWRWSKLEIRTWNLLIKEWLKRK